MSEYFIGNERLQTFEKTGTFMRMATPGQLEIPDYQIVRELLLKGNWDEAGRYISTFHAQNMFMNSVFFEWCIIMINYYAELTSVEAEKKFRVKAIKDYKALITKMGESYPAENEQLVIEQMKSLMDADNLGLSSGDYIFADMEKDFNELQSAFNSQDLSKSLKLLTSFHRHCVIRHDSLATFVYSYPTSIIEVDGEKMAVEVSNGSVLRNERMGGIWELTKILTPLDLAAFLAEHLRFHFSGEGREGKTTIVEDDKKIKLIFDPCGSGGAIRRRLGEAEVKLNEKHDLAWNKCGEVNLYCSHCALNEKISIDLFGYPKLVVDFQADGQKPCGWTVYKDPKDIPAEVYQRLGLTKT